MVIYRCRKDSALINSLYLPKQRLKSFTCLDFCHEIIWCYEQFCLRFVIYRRLTCLMLSLGYSSKFSNWGIMSYYLFMNLLTFVVFIIRYIYVWCFQLLAFVMIVGLFIYITVHCTFTVTDILLLIHFMLDQSLKQRMYLIFITPDSSFLNLKNKKRFVAECNPIRKKRRNWSG